MTTIKINLAATTCQEKTGLSKKCVRFFQDETIGVVILKTIQ